MRNALFKKRGLFLVMVIGSVMLFIALVWLVANLVPLNWLGQGEPSATGVVLRTGKNCTYPLAFWKAHPDEFPSQVVLGSRVYRTGEIQAALSGETQEPQMALQAQLFGAFLNMLAGADQELIRATVYQAYEWLVQHPSGNPLTDGEMETVTRLTSVLQAYNSGQAGVAQCTGVVLPRAVSSTVRPSAIVTVSPTFTPSQTITSSPEATSTATSTQFYPVVTVFVPTQTRPPTREPTNEPPPPTNTQAPPPVPTNTPAPPTQEPTVTLTLPPPQVTNTLPPPP